MQCGLLRIYYIILCFINLNDTNNARFFCTINIINMHKSWRFILTSDLMFCLCTCVRVIATVREKQIIFYVCK